MFVDKDDGLGMRPGEQSRKGQNMFTDDAPIPPWDRSPGVDLSDEERHFARHALGLTNKKTAYRNWYCAGGSDAQIGASLVRKGMAVHFPPGEGFPDHRFMISTRGFEAVREPGEMLGREEAERIKRVDAKAFIGSEAQL